jgi:hypothetical protein
MLRAAAARNPTRTASRLREEGIALVQGDFALPLARDILRQLPSGLFSGCIVQP